MAAINRLMPPGAIVVEEAPTHRNALRDFLPIAISGGFYCVGSSLSRQHIRKVFRASLTLDVRQCPYDRALSLPPLSRGWIYD